MILFVGDIHGRIAALEKVYEDAVRLQVKAIIQVGDFGICWPGKPNGLEAFFNKSKPGIPFYFCDGNHENHRVLDELHTQQNSSIVEVAKNCFHVRRSTILNIFEKKILFFGGAQSYLGKRDEPFIIDKNWWPQEMPALEEFDAFKEAFSKSDIVVTHDCPSFLMKDKKYHKLWSKNAVPQFLQATVSSSNHVPEYWFFGHHHEHDTWDIDHTKYYCCGKHGESWLYTGSNCVKQGLRTVE
jgi:DNA repair exonuclease SbcCD nuclease subunit